jgi:type II secretory pathway pseudopilin PulG
LVLLGQEANLNALEGAMAQKKCHREGATLAEVLVVIAIVGVLAAMLIPAVQKAREAAARLQGMNNLKQISLAVHLYVDANGGYLPSLDGWARMKKTWEGPVFTAILPYLEQGNIYADYRAQNRQSYWTSEYPIPLYVSPMDPTVLPSSTGATSYAANALVFARPSRLSSAFLDGMSNTIAFGEHYARGCGGQADFSWLEDTQTLIPPQSRPPTVLRRATFADQAMGDVIPVWQGQTTQPSVAGLSFQVQPTVEECDPRVSQTAYTGGMLTALGDGSVRVLAAGISISTYWAAVTPNGRELLGNDWE